MMIIIKVNASEWKWICRKVLVFTFCSVPRISKMYVFYQKLFYYKNVRDNWFFITYKNNKIKKLLSLHF